MNGETFIAYTVMEGGYFHAKLQRCTDEEYEAIRSAGELQVWDSSTDVMVTVPVAFVALVRIEKNFDFVLGKSRG